MALPAQSDNAQSYSSAHVQQLILATGHAAHPEALPQLSIPAKHAAAAAVNGHLASPRWQQRPRLPGALAEAYTRGYPLAPHPHWTQSGMLSLSTVIDTVTDGM
jgi:hypothetical protein